MIAMTLLTHETGKLQSSAKAGATATNQAAAALNAPITKD
jgi:hypothetical protein